VSRYGLVAFASSLDQVGPFAKDVQDCALVLNSIAGQCAHDATSSPTPVPDYTSFLSGDVRGLRIGVPREYFIEGMQPEVRRSVEEAIALYERMGASVNRELSLPTTKYALAAYYIIAPSEASANLARYDGVKYGFSRRLATSEESVSATRGAGFGQEVKRRIMLGTYPCPPATTTPTTSRLSRYGTSYARTSPGRSRTMTYWRCPRPPRLRSRWVRGLTTRSRCT
jgi:aspartyl-tRNA(Asn)/glutamyl-tRNA(Gln) amidotransferase subunit A